MEANCKVEIGTAIPSLCIRCGRTTANVVYYRGTMGPLCAFCAREYDLIGQPPSNKEEEGDQ